MWQPESTPQTDSIQDLRAYVERQFLQLAPYVNDLQVVHYDVQHVAPERVESVNFGYFAAGVVGVLEGFYYYNGTAWIAAPRAPSSAFLYSTGNVAQAFPAVPTWAPVAAINAKGTDFVSVANVAAKTITINESRLYLVGGFASMVADKNNCIFTLGISVNGAAPVLPQTTVGTGRQVNDQINMRGVAPAFLPAGTTLQLQIQNNDPQAHNTTIRNSTLWAVGL